MTAGKGARRGRLDWFTTIPGLTVAAMIALTAGFAGAATINVLTQTVPAGTVPSSGFGPTCASVTMLAGYSKANTTAAEAVYSCVSSSALNVTSSGSRTPTYALPTAFSDAFLVSSTASGNPVNNLTAPLCSGYTGAISLTSGSPLSLSTGKFDYCFDSTQPGAAITQFTVTWS